MFIASMLLIRRGIINLVKKPATPLMGLGMSIFFLIVYNAGIGGIGFLSEFGNAGYLAFIFPITIVSLAMGSSSGAGHALHADMESGYFRRIFLTPVSRWSLAAAPLIADGIATLAMTILLLITAVVFNIPFRFGFLSALGILLFSVLWGMTLSGFSAGIMLLTGNNQGAQMVVNAVFPLIFLSSTFLPRGLIKSKWLLVVSRFNPVTYVLEGIRHLLGGTGEYGFFTAGLVILSVSCFLAVTFAALSSRKIAM